MEDKNPDSALETGVSDNNIEDLTLTGPVKKAERIDSVDILRGFALLGILVININTFAFPQVAMDNPSVYGGATGVNLLTWEVSQLFFFQKFMAIFSMLFGAGLILMGRRASERGVSFIKVYYRRLIILLGFGIIHAYFIWWGDILFYYAVSGLILYPLRKLSPRTLIIIGLMVVLVAVPLTTGMGLIFNYFKTQAEQAEAAKVRGEELSGDQESAIEMWEQMRTNMMPSEKTINKELEAYRSGYGEIFIFRLINLLFMQTLGFLFMIFWRVAGLMLVGMGLMKLGIFSADRSRSLYIWMLIIGYGAGLPIVGYGNYQIVANDFDWIFYMMQGSHYNYIGSILVSMGHIALVMLWCKSSFWKDMKRRLAAVGRTALSNYIGTSLVMTTIFYGYGLGLFGYYERHELIPFVLGMWVIQLIVSPVWLNYFRFGPLEWLWRTMTYMKPQPMRGQN